MVFLFRNVERNESELRVENEGVSSGIPGLRVEESESEKRMNGDHYCNVVLVRGESGVAGQVPRRNDRAHILGIYRATI